ncbi:unnamed protein product [Rotaria sp. Silwood2]|nr:unnamed protein product [Rotaria sp. Silwood2]CAF2734473.1 unnamed protein product [Rotaria sp. Silwood2]CAF2966093.1 unnamed protein product [Rotaria sp. Silwood2]CAF3855097.1 unnamed protein product [Rotaria sp. Silwood2]CAF3940537.1 unnamed protein product [Rotaria sp. Silwood2]
MTRSQSFIDLLSTNLAYLFHNYLFVKNKQTCSHKLSSNKTLNLVKKVRININKYGHLLNSNCSQEIKNNNNNKLISKDIALKRKKKSKKTKIRDQEKKRQSEKMISIQSSVPRIDYHQSSMISRVSSSTSSILSDIQILEQNNNSIDSTLYISDQCREKMQFLYNMGPIVNKNYINTHHLSNELDLIKNRQHKKMNEYSTNLKPEQLFRCPKDSRSKRRKCCGVYYELFNDALRLLEEWFTIK